MLLRMKSVMNQKLTPWKVRIASSSSIVCKSKKTTQSTLFSLLCSHCLKIIQCIGKKKSSATPGSSCLVLQCRVLPMQEVAELDAALNTSTFMSVHSLDMKFTYCQSRYVCCFQVQKANCFDPFWAVFKSEALFWPRVVKLTGFQDTELLGQSMYQYYHPSDCQQIRKAHVCCKTDFLSFIFQFCA